MSFRWLAVIETFRLFRGQPTLRFPAELSELELSKLSEVDEQI